MAALLFLACATFMQLASAQVVRLVQPSGGNIQSLASNNIIPYPNTVNSNQIQLLNNGNPSNTNTANIANGIISNLANGFNSQQNLNAINPLSSTPSCSNAKLNLAGSSYQPANPGYSNSLVVSSSTQGNPEYGIQIVSEALEVGGNVMVNGRYPIYGVVELGGTLPSEGNAVVNYVCGQEPQQQCN